MSGVKGVMEVKQIKRTRKYCGHETSSSTEVESAYMMSLRGNNIAWTSKFHGKVGAEYTKI